MCRAISGIAVLADGAVKVYTSKVSDSHTVIREEHKIRDDSGPGATRQTPVELVPVRGLALLAEMDFHFDADRPDWWTDEHTEQAKVQMFAAWRARWVGVRLHFSGHLDLRSLTSLPANAKLSAGGDLDLRSLTSLPANAKLSAGGDLNLGSLTSLPANAKLSAGGYLNLGSLTSLPANETLESIRAAAKALWLKQKALADEARKAVGG